MGITVIRWPVVAYTSNRSRFFGWQNSWVECSGGTRFSIGPGKGNRPSVILMHPHTNEDRLDPSSLTQSHRKIKQLLATNAILRGDTLRDLGFNLWVSHGYEIGSVGHRSGRSTVWHKDPHTRYLLRQQKESSTAKFQRFISATAHTKGPLSWTHTSVKGNTSYTNRYTLIRIESITDENRPTGFVETYNVKLAAIAVVSQKLIETRKLY